NVTQKPITASASDNTAAMPSVYSIARAVGSASSPLSVPCLDVRVSAANGGRVSELSTLDSESPGAESQSASGRPVPGASASSAVASLVSSAIANGSSD